MYEDFRVVGERENIFETLVNQIVEEAKLLGIDQCIGKEDEITPKIEELKQQLYDRISTLMRL